MNADDDGRANARDAVDRRDVLAKATLAATAVLTSSAHAFGQDGKSPMSNDQAAKDLRADLTANEVRTLLGLEPNATCGFVRVTFMSKQTIAAGGLPAPFADQRPLGSALYFMVTPTAPVRLHRIRNDQLYHYYMGDPLEVFMLHDDGTHQRVVVGPDLRGGERVQLFIPGNTFHTARLIGRRRWFLGASTEWPGVVPADVEIGNLDALAAKHPDIAGDMRAIMASVQPVPAVPGAPR